MNLRWAWTSRPLMVPPNLMPLFRTSEPCVSLTTTWRVLRRHLASKDAVFKHGSTPGTIFGAPLSPAWEER